jgi:tetratricopeptide (TPR) repeat protein
MSAEDLKNFGVEMANNNMGGAD